VPIDAGRPESKPNSAQATGVVVFDHDAGSSTRDPHCPPDDLFCDVLEPDCQDRIFQVTQCLSGLTRAQRPPVRTITLGEYEELLAAQRSGLELAPIEIRYSKAQQLLGLRSRDQSLREAYDATSAALVAAFYSATDDEVVLIDRGTPRVASADVEIMAHELAHALRFAELDPSFGRQPTNDASVARRGLTEGEAEVIAQEVVAHSQCRAPSEVDWSSVGSEMTIGALRTVLRAGDAFDTAWSFLPQILGTARIGPRWRALGRAATEPLFENPPATFLYWFDGGETSSAPEPFGCDTVPAPPGYVADDDDTLGPIGAFALPLALGDSDVGTAFARAAEWRADRLVIFRPEDDPDSTTIAVSWRLKFDPAVIAGRYADAIEDRLPFGARLEVQGAEVVLSAAEDAAVMETWSQDCGSTTAQR